MCYLRFAHQKGELRALPDLTCTKLCKTLIQTGTLCKFLGCSRNIHHLAELRGHNPAGTCDDAKCTYAHSKDELRATSTFPQRGRLFHGSCVASCCR